MGDPVKRNAFLDWVFGVPLAGDDLERHLAARPPRWARNIQMTLFLLILVLMAAGYLGWTDKLPLVGPWLARERALVSMGCLATILALSSYFKRQGEMKRRQ